MGRTLYSIVLPLLYFSVLCKNHTFSLTVSEREVKQPGSIQWSSWIFVSGLQEVRGKICQETF